MVNAATPVHILTIEEYLELEERSTIRHEYVGGELYAQAGASEAHNLIVANVHGHLWAVSRNSTCKVYANDMKLRAAPDAMYYPDVMVVRDPNDDDPLAKSRPCLIVEVLSPTTEHTDRREKLLAYRRIDSLKAYVMVYQDQRRVTRQWRDDGNAWWQEDIVDDGVVPLPCPEIALTLDEIYERTSLDRRNPRSSL